MVEDGYFRGKERGVHREYYNISKRETAGKREEISSRQ